MSKQRIVNDSFWTDPYIEDLDPSEKLLFIYLITNPLCNIAGVYEIKLKRIAYETGFDKEMVERILKRFGKDKKIILKDSWIIISNFIKNQSTNPSVLRGIERILKDLPPSVLQAVTASPQAGTYLTLLNLTLPNSTLPNSTDLTETDSFEIFWKVYPKKEMKKKSQEIWKQKKISTHLNSILEFIEKAKKTDRWKAGFIKQPTTFLNNECWNDLVESYNNRPEPVKILKISKN